MKRIYFLLDESGSMMSIIDKAVDGFNGYVNEIRGSKKTRFTLISFNSTGCHVHYDQVSVKKVEPLLKENYRPTSSTPLYDSIAYTIELAEKTVVDGDTVVIVTLTDGLENDSKEHSLSSAKALIEAKRAKGWAFVYMGANQDAWLVGGSLGIPKGFTHTYNVEEVGKAMRSAANGTVRYMQSVDAGSPVNSFFEEPDDQTDGLDEKDKIKRVTHPGTFTSSSS